MGAADQGAMRLPALLLARSSPCRAAAPGSPPRGRREEGRPLNVLLVTLDTTRADHIGAYGYGKAQTPVLDALARNGVRFANAVLPDAADPPFALLDPHGDLSAPPQGPQQRVLLSGEDAVTLAERLKESGYTTAAFVASFNTDSRFGLGQGFDVYDDRFLEDELLKTFKSERTADKVADAFISWLDGRIPGPGSFPGSISSIPTRPMSRPRPIKKGSPGDPYDGEIAFMDHELGRIIEALKAEGRFSTGP